jgi:hypothetical protein
MVKKDYTPYSHKEVRNILKWLTGKQNSWLKLYDIEGEEIVEFYGRFTMVNETIADSRVLGFICTFTATSPFGYSALRDVRQTFTNTETIIIENDTDDPENLVKPYVTITPTSDILKLTITNKTTNRQTIIEDIKAGEKITIDNENKLVFSNDIYRVIGSKMYGEVDGDYTTNYPIWIEFCDGDNELVFDFSSKLRPQTKLAVITLASNVCGKILPVARIASICKQRGIILICDASQGAGCIPINVKSIGADVVCFAGHKSLYGPQGTGGAIFCTDKIPNSVIFLISPSITSPTLCDSAKFFQGFGVHCFNPREIRRFSRSISKTITSTLAPVEITFEG